MPQGWTPVCRLVELQVERGAAALVHGQAVAIFRMYDDTVHALANHDPFSHASVLARGIVGTRTVGAAGAGGTVEDSDRVDVPFVASPMHKHAFDLRTGRCLDDGQVSVPAYEVRVDQGMVLVGPRKPSP